MIKKVFTTYDSKAEIYTEPFMMRSVGEALRALETVVNEPTHNLHKYAEDYTLFEIGEYDDTTGRYTMHESLKSLVNCIELKKPLGIVQESLKTTKE